jgi:hypothetical protein
LKEEVWEEVTQPVAPSSGSTGPKLFTNSKAVK